MGHKLDRKNGDHRGGCLSRPDRLDEFAWAVRDLGRIAQIARVSAKRYPDEVGSWRAHSPDLWR